MRWSVWEQRLIDHIRLDQEGAVMKLRKPGFFAKAESKSSR